MSARFLLAAAALSLSLHSWIGTVDGLCIGEPKFGPSPQGTDACINDPSDSSNLELYLVFDGSCDDQHATWYQSVVFWGTDDKRSTAVATDTHTLPPGPTSGTMTFHYDLPITAFKPGEAVGVRGYAQDDENWRRADYYVDWVQDFSVGAVRGRPAAGGSGSVVTETVTEIVTQTSAETVEETHMLLATATAVATKTVKARRETVTSQVTITPLPQIITERSITTSTKAITCRERHIKHIPARQHGHPPAGQILPRQESSYVAPGCGVSSNSGSSDNGKDSSDNGAAEPSTTTITKTETVFGSETVITTHIDESVKAVSSISPSEDTLTITPTRVKRQYSIAKRPTKTVTGIYTVTKSVYPLGSGPLPGC